MVVGTPPSERTPPPSFTIPRETETPAAAPAPPPAISADEQRFRTETERFMREVGGYENNEAIHRFGNDQADFVRRNGGDFAAAANNWHQDTNAAIALRNSFVEHNSTLPPAEQTNWLTFAGDHDVFRKDTAELTAINTAFRSEHNLPPVPAPGPVTTPSNPLAPSAETASAQPAPAQPSTPSPQAAAQALAALGAGTNPLAAAAATVAATPGATVGGSGWWADLRSSQTAQRPPARQPASLGELLTQLMGSLGDGLAGLVTGLMGLFSAMFTGGGHGQAGATPAGGAAPPRETATSTPPPGHGAAAGQNRGHAPVVAGAGQTSPVTVTQSRLQPQQPELGSNPAVIEVPDGHTCSIRRNDSGGVDVVMHENDNSGRAPRTTTRELTADDIQDGIQIVARQARSSIGGQVVHAGGINLVFRNTPNVPVMVTDLAGVGVRPNGHQPGQVAFDQDNPNAAQDAARANGVLRGNNARAARREAHAEMRTAQAERHASQLHAAAQQYHRQGGQPLRAHGPQYGHSGGAQTAPAATPVAMGPAPAGRDH